MKGGDGGWVQEGKGKGIACWARAPFRVVETSQNQTEVIVAQHSDRNKCHGSILLKTVHD